jgi:hypothetical protein
LGLEQGRCFHWRGVTVTRVGKAKWQCGDKKGNWKQMYEELHEFPYRRLMSHPLWSVISKVVSDLEANGDLKLETPSKYVVGSLVEAVEKSEKSVREYVERLRKLSFPDFPSETGFSVRSRDTEEVRLN